MKQRFFVRSETGKGWTEVKSEEFTGHKGEPLPPKIAEPTAAELASNFLGAMERWAAAGFKTVTQEQHDVRASICEPCEYWDGKARFGLGKCKAPGCGCTKFKRWLATEQCKHPDGSKWPEIKQPLPSSETGATA